MGGIPGFLFNEVVSDVGLSLPVLGANQRFISSTIGIADGACGCFVFTRNRWT